MNIISLGAGVQSSTMALMAAHGEIQYEKDLEDKTKALVHLESKEFLHSSRIPFDQVDFSTDEDRGQLNMFNNECEGLCGV